MRTHILKLGLASLLFAGLAAGCGDDDDDFRDIEPDAAPDVEEASYRQVEHLARPGINEALLISEGFLAGYNATAPSFEGVPSDTLDAVVGEAKTVLKAIYLGSCLLNGALSLTADTGVHPAGIACHDVGPAVWEEAALDGVTLTEASQTAAQAYADKVFAQFVPDVMRIDTSVPSNYLTLCGDADSTPLLCGGRLLRDDSIDITYNYLINGAATTNGDFDQVRALTGDGVNFSLDEGNNSGNVSDPVANPAQGHPNVSDTFPYSAAPV